MRFSSIGAGSFGCLRDWQSSEISSDLVVFYGPNESGKTTLFNLMTTILYGWYPPSGSKNIYMPWDESLASCHATLESSDLKRLEVSRTLRSKPDGNLTVDGKSLNLGNDPLPQLAFLPRLIYSEVFAITIEQLRFPEKKAWEKLQDQLLGGQYATFLRPVSELASELEYEATRLWRPDRRGKPEAKELKSRMAVLNKEKRVARENEGILHSLEASLEAKKTEIEDLDTQKTAILIRQNRSERLAPVYKKIKRIDELSDRIINANILAELPLDPEKELNELEGQIEEQCQTKEKLLGQLRNYQRGRDGFTPSLKKICGCGEHIRSLSKSFGRLEIDLQRELDLDGEIESCRGRIQERARDLLQGGWQEKLAGILKRIDEAELRAAIEGYKRAESRFQELKSKASGLTARLGGGNKYKKLPILAAVFLLLGFIGLVVSESPQLGFGSVLLWFLSLLLILAWWILKGDKAAKSELAQVEKELAGLKTALQGRLNAVVVALQGLPVAGSWLEWPGESLLLEVSRLKEYLLTVEEKISEQEKVRQAIQDAKSVISRLLDVCEIPPSERVLDNINLLETHLLKAEKVAMICQAACKGIEDVNGELSIVGEKIERAEQKKFDLAQSLKKIEGNTFEDRIANLAEQRKWHRQITLLEEDLKREYPDLNYLLDEIKGIEYREGESLLLGDEELALLKVEKERIEDRLNRLNNDIGILEKDLEYRQEKTRLDDLEGEIEQVKSDYRQAYTKRDRLLLLRNIIVEGDRKFREEHQPEILSLAGNYLKTITRGRYERLLLKDGEEPGLVARGDYYHSPVDVALLSRGTLRQVYLALRLALIDHIDNAGEPLPVFLDEVLVHWDGQRLVDGLDLLARISGKRQVFLFTCHQWIVEKLKDIGHIQIINI